MEASDGVSVSEIRHFLRFPNFFGHNSRFAKKIDESKKFVSAFVLLRFALILEDRIAIEIDENDDQEKLNARKFLHS